jgi:hypothetical protein
MSQPDVPTLFVHWESFLNWLLDRTEKFPKRLRFTLTSRIDNLALDIYTRVVEARYRRDRVALLERLNLDLELLRLLLRLARDRRVLDHRAFAHACEQIDTAGRMVGGWLRYQKG